MQNVFPRKTREHNIALSRNIDMHGNLDDDALISAVLNENYHQTTNIPAIKRARMRRHRQQWLILIFQPPLHVVSVVCLSTEMLCGTH